MALCVCSYSRQEFQLGHCSQALSSIPAGRICPDIKKSWEILLEAGVAVWIFGISAPFPRDGGCWMDVTDRDVLGRASRGIRVELVVPKLFDPLLLFVWIFLLSQEFLGDLGSEHRCFHGFLLLSLRMWREGGTDTSFIGNDREGRAGDKAKSGIWCHKWEFFGIGKGLIPGAASSGGMGLFNPKSISSIPWDRAEGKQGRIIPVKVTSGLSLSQA